MKHTLEVYLSENLIFYSDGKWLHPLLELDKFLSNSNYDRTKLVVKDKIIGRAAALILIYLGIKNVKAGIMSKLGKNALEKHEICYEYKDLVERIQCKTEELLKNEHDYQKAYKLIKKLANNSG